MKSPGTLTVNVPGDVLFASGKADLKDTAKSTLSKIANAAKKRLSRQADHRAGIHRRRPDQQDQG